MRFLSRTWARLVQPVKTIATRVYHLPILHPVLQVTGYTARDFYRDDCLIMAAAIAFYAILSLIPFLLLLMSIAGYILEYTGGSADTNALFIHLTSAIRSVVPFLSDDLIDRLEGMMANRGTYGITGLISLLITAGGVFRTLELAFSKVFKAKRTRSLIVSQLLVMVFVLSIGLLFLIVHFLGNVASAFYSARDSHFSQLLDSFLDSHFLLRLGITLVVASGVFVVLIKYFSKERIRWRFALGGGLLFAILWVIAIRLFGYYLNHVAQFSLLYGSLATLAVIVVWIFYSATILLLCAEFTQVLQSRGAPGQPPTVANRAAETPAGR